MTDPTNNQQSTREVSAFPYATHLDILYPALTHIDLDPLVDAVQDTWYNQTLCQVNDSVVRLGVMQGEYHWHKHDDDDEFFFVLEGLFLSHSPHRRLSDSTMPRPSFDRFV